MVNSNEDDINHQLFNSHQQLPIPLDPILTSIDHHHHPSSSSTTTVRPKPTPPQPRNNITTTRLPKSKLIQCEQLNQAAQQALEGVWETLQTANQSNDQLTISRNLDRQFGELHASAAPFKQDALALIWPQCISNKTLKAAFASRLSPAYFAIRRANIAFVAEYVLYAMPGEEAYGKNDIVFACEGFLPLVLDPEMVLEPQSWNLFNELKVQIYIQRLDQSGQEEADSRVLPNLFVESLSSYSGLEVPTQSEIEFEKLATATKEELIGAGADLELLQSRHPYTKFAVWALEFLHRCASRVDQEAQEQDQASSLVALSRGDPKPKKRARQSEDGPVPSSPLTSPAAPAIPPTSPHSSSLQADINVGPTSEEEYTQEGEHGSKGYNPYRLGRGKGPTAAPRRRWTQEEYELLLEEVRLHSNKYDCMAQIMKRHGRGGEISEILKDQNNVSLKDKARNLTMEWQRHGYPEDKPWLKEAFARFSVKNLKRYTQRSAGETTGEGEAEVGGGEGVEEEGAGSWENNGTAGETRRPKRVRPTPSVDRQIGPATDDPPDIGVLPSFSFPAVDGFDQFSLDISTSLDHHHHHHHHENDLALPRIEDLSEPRDLTFPSSSEPPIPPLSEIHPLLASSSTLTPTSSTPISNPVPIDLGPLNDLIPSTLSSTDLPVSSVSADPPLGSSDNPLFSRVPFSTPSLAASAAAVTDAISAAISALVDGDTRTAITHPASFTHPSFPDPVINCENESSLQMNTIPILMDPSLL